MAFVRPFSQIPGPRSWPILGTILQYRIGPYEVEKFHDSLIDLHQRYGNIVRQNFAGLKVVHLFDPDDFQKVYGVDGKYPEIVPLLPTLQLYRKKRQFNLGLGNLNGEEWYKLRKHIQRVVLQPLLVRNYLPVVEETATKFVENIKRRRDENYQIKDLNILISKVILDNAGKVILDESFGGLDGGKDEQIAQEMIANNLENFRLSTLLRFSLPIYRYFPTPKWTRFIKTEDIFFNFMSSHIQKAVDNRRKLLDREKLEDKPHDFLLHLLSQPDFSDEQIFILLNSVLVDGLSTSSPALVSILWCLSRNQDAQKKLYEEIQRVLPNNERITSEKLEMMPFLRACVKEGLRLFPTGTEVSRVLKKDLVLSNYHVPAGTNVELNNLVLYKSNQYFPDAETFKPDRWLKTGDSSSLNSHFLYLPFSHGIRMCAGRRIAEQDLHVLVCRIIQNFHLECKSDIPLKSKYAVLLFPDHSPLITFNDREMKK